MATSAISNSIPTYQALNQQPDFRQEFRQLVTSLKSGDLDGAQQAYAAISQLQSNGAAPPTNANSPIGQALSQIGQALQKGDLAGAQQALSALSQQAHGTHHGHHHRGGATSAGASASGASTDANASSDGSGNTINIVA
jgi:hypothetical protein